MTSIIKKIRNRVWRVISDFALIITVLCETAKKSRLTWLAYFVRYRAQYFLGALHSGIAMNSSGQGYVYNFRRNIHRIEKGLSYTKRKSEFAKSYIMETVRYLEKIKSSVDSDCNTTAWGEAVLNKYFKLPFQDDEIKAAHDLFKKIQPHNSEPGWIPYAVCQRPALTIDYDSLYQLSLRRRSVRNYLDKRVDADVFKKAMKVAALSPSACNRQAFKFMFFNEKEITGKICEIPGGFSGFEAPSVAVVVGSYRGYFDERDMTVPIIDSSLAVMSLILALETLGLSSVCINWPLLTERDASIRRLIQLENDEFVVLLIAIGYADPDGIILYSGKKDIENLFSINRFLK